MKREARASGVGLKREARASSVDMRRGRRALVSSVTHQALSIKRRYQALSVEREASVGAEREANMKRALTQEREASVKQALASSMVSGPRFARPCTMLSTMLTWRQS